MKARRAIEIEFEDGSTKELEIKKAASLNLSKENEGRIYLEQMKDGNWRLVYDEKTIPDFTKVKRFNIIRE